MTDRDDRDWPRLARAAIAQRAALGDPPQTTIMRNAGTWRSFTDHVSDDPAKRAKATRLTPPKLRELERGLGWAVGVADKVLAGGDPWLKEDDPELPEDADGIWYLRGGEVRALLPDDPVKRLRVIQFIDRHGEVIDLGDSSGDVHNR